MAPTERELSMSSSMPLGKEACDETVSAFIRGSSG